MSIHHRVAGIVIEGGTSHPQISASRFVWRPGLVDAGASSGWSRLPVRSISILVALTMPSLTWAFDTEPNDSCATAEPIAAVASGQGSLSSTDTQDSFESPPMVPGDWTLRLVNLSNTSDDFEIELFDSSSTSVASATSIDGVAELTYSISTALSTFCVALTGSQGDYDLLADLVATPPSITDVQDSGGSSITSASIGDTITILGTAFGASASDTTVTFGGVVGEITSISPTSIDVVVPLNAVNGDIYVLRADVRSDAYSFSVGVSSLAASTATAPDPSWLNTGAGPKVYLNRTLVTFSPSADSTDVSTALDAVLALDTNRNSWTEVGFSPRRNAYQIEWAWISTYTPAAADTLALLDDLEAESDILGVDAEFPVTPFGIEQPADHDHLHDAGIERAAFHQVGLTEASRLFRYSALSSLSTAPAVVMVDTGLRYGVASWDSGSECITGTVGSGGSNDEFPTSHFGLVELDSGGAWSTTAAPGHFAQSGGSKQVHGNSMAAIIGARSQGEPDWDDGAARSGLNGQGVLASFDLQGIDDDGDSNFDLDDIGESIPYDVVVFNGFSKAGAPSWQSNWFVFEAFEAITNDPTYDDSLLFLATGWNRSNLPMKYWYRHNAVVRDLCRDRIVVASSGNEGENVGVGNWAVQGNALASALTSLCPETAIVVGGTEAGGSGGGTDTRWSHPSIPKSANYGEAVTLLSPAVGFTHPTVCTNGGVYNGYLEGNVATSPAGALIAGEVALIRGIVDEATLSNAGIVQLIENASDDVSSLYTDDGAQRRADLYLAVQRALDLAGGLPDHMQGTTRLFAVDYSNDILVAEDIADLETGTLGGSSTRDTATTTSDGCYGPSDVEAHPNGDVVYVLCADTAEVAAYRASDLDYIGSVVLDGTVTSYSELEVTADGIVRVPTVNAGGELTLESFDSYSGSKHLDAETLYSASTMADAYAIRATSDSVNLAVVATDGSAASDDYDVMSLVAPDPAGKTASAVTNDDLTGTSLSYLARDVDWRYDDSTAIALFHGDGSGSDIELFENDWASTSNDTTVDYCEDPTSLAINPTGDDEVAYIACQDDYHVAVVDIASSTVSSYTPAFYLYGSTSSSGASDLMPTVVEYADNGKFIYAGFQYIGGGSGWSYVITAEHDAVLSSSSTDLYLGSYDIMAYTGFDKPRGMDMTPLLSVMSPRPGTEISGVRTLHAVVRDDTVVEVNFYEGTSTLCTDSTVLDGLAECAVDWSTLSAGATTVEVEATTSSGDTYSIHVPYTVL